MQDFLTVLIISWILFRLFRPVVYVHWSKPQQHNYSSANQQSSTQGEVTVNKSSTRNRNIPDDAGEYVDFEELPKS